MNNIGVTTPATPEGNHDYEIPEDFASDLEELYQALDAYNQDRKERGLMPLILSQLMWYKRKNIPLP